MKLVGTSLSLLALLCACPVSVRADDSNRARALVEECRTDKAACEEYLLGVWDAVLIYGEMVHAPMFCTSVGPQGGQLHAAFDRWVVENPDKMGLSRVTGAVLALKHAYPCEGPAKTDDDGFNSPPATARSGDFAVGLIATTDPDRLMADWLKPTPGAALASSSQATRNQPIVTFIVFKGCRADTAGNCDVTADFQTLDPSGRPYDQTKTAAIWVGHPPAPDLKLQLSQAGYGLRFEDKDALGPYRVRATITDHVAGVTLQTEEVLTAVAK